MSAHYFGGEVKETKRYKLGRLAGSVDPSPPADDGDAARRQRGGLPALPGPARRRPVRGQARGTARTRSTRPTSCAGWSRRSCSSSTARRCSPSGAPTRRIYPLSDGEALLYERVTEYVREEMNRAERLKAEGEGRRGAVVGFALTILQRRLASSPEAIYQSLARRRRRLEQRESPRSGSGKRGAEVAASSSAPKCRPSSADIDEDFDIDDLPEGELEELEEELVDEASAARTIAELEHEIATLAGLEELARQVRDVRRRPQVGGAVDAPPGHAGDVRRRRRPAEADHLHRAPRHPQLPRRQAAGAARARRKRSSRSTAGMPREERRKVQEAFTQDKDVLVLVATDAAGEGINLQRAHLMVNYDLPWNPNRIEQRFGRIHRIGQTEVCHLWNLVAEDTREGEVFQRLLEKLDEQRKALGDQVFDVLGEAFRGQDAARPADRGDPLRRAARA